MAERFAVSSLRNLGDVGTSGRKMQLQPHNRTSQFPVPQSCLQYGYPARRGKLHGNSAGLRSSHSLCSPPSLQQCSFIGQVPAKLRGSSTRAMVADEGVNRPVQPVATMESDYSPLASQELTLFLFQMQFDSQLQRALNYENFEAAQTIRAQREQVDLALQRLQATKGGGCGTRVAMKAELADAATEGLRLRSEMQRAVEEERYDDAARIRDTLKELGARAGSERDWQRGGKDESRMLRLGQRVVHSTHGYRGVVCGWDAWCCEEEAWKQRAGIESLSDGPGQTFYHILIDIRDQALSQTSANIAYVAEELLEPYKRAPPVDTLTGLEEDDFNHPYSYMLFFGKDLEGNLVPSRKLREKYSEPRHEVGGEEPTGDGIDSQ